LNQQIRKNRNLVADEEPEDANADKPKCGKPRPDDDPDLATREESSISSIADRAEDTDQTSVLKTTIH